MTDKAKEFLKKLIPFRSQPPPTQQKSQQSNTKPPKFNKIQIMLMGASCTGKTATLTKYITGHYIQNISATVGACFNKKQMSINVMNVYDDTVQNIVFQIQIWDTNGLKISRALYPIYMKNTNCYKVCVIFYNVTQQKSFQEVEQFHQIWVRNIATNSREKSSVILVGNHIDREPTQNSTSMASEKGLQLAKKLGAFYIRSSSFLRPQKIFDMAIDLALSQNHCTWVRQNSIFGTELKKITKNKQKQFIQVQKLNQETVILLYNYLVKLNAIKYNCSSQKVDLEQIGTQYIKVQQYKKLISSGYKNLELIHSSIKYLQDEVKNRQSTDTNNENSSQNKIETEFQQNTNPNKQIFSQKAALEEIAKKYKIQLLQISKNIDKEYSKKFTHKNPFTSQYNRKTFQELRQIKAKLACWFKPEEVLMKSAEIIERHLITMFEQAANLVTMRQQLLQQSQRINNLMFDTEQFPETTPQMLLSNLISNFISTKSPSPNQNSPLPSITTTTIKQISPKNLNLSISKMEEIVIQVLCRCMEKREDINDNTKHLNAYNCQMFKKMFF